VRTRSWTVVLLVFDEVELLDVAGSVQALSQCGRNWNWRPFKIVVVAKRAGLVSTRNQLRIEATHDFASAPEPEVLLLPGGYGARPASEDQELIDFVRERGANAELVAGLGHGTLVLARAGFLDGVEVAAQREVAELLGEVAPSARPDPTRRLVDSGRVLSAQSGAASIDLGLAIIARLLGKKQALAVSAQLGHETHEPEKLRIDILPPTK
jgi:transcriptional regulator GlxA family with amidase domain